MNPIPNHESSFRRIRLFALFGSLALSAQASNVVGRTVRQGSSEPEYFQVTKDHAAMHQAVTEARKTDKKFITALKHPAPGQQDFQVKKPFVQGDQVEHIWKVPTTGANFSTDKTSAVAISGITTRKAFTVVTVAGVTAVAIKVEAAVEPEATAVAGVATKQALASFA